MLRPSLQENEDIFLSITFRSWHVSTTSSIAISDKV